MNKLEILKDCFEKLQLPFEILTDPYGDTLTGYKHFLSLHTSGGYIVFRFNKDNDLIDYEILY